MSPSNVVRSFEALERVLQQMLDAAHTREWNTLEALRHRYAHETARLKLHDDEAPASDEERACRAALLQRILALDAQVRDLATQRIAVLGAMLQSAGVATHR